MSAQRQLTFVRRAALVLMIPVGIEAIYYTQRMIYRALRFCFFEPDRWANHRLVEPDAVIPMAARIQYFGIWIAVILASILCFAIALYVLNRVRQGLIFDPRTARGIAWLGASLAFALAFDQVFAAVDLHLLTRFNPLDVIPIHWNYDPSDYKAIALGLILFLFGAVMRRAIEVARENEGYV
jgi:hypothetical protein